MTQLSDALSAAIRRKYGSPRAALNALGIDANLLGAQPMRRPTQTRRAYDQDPTVDPVDPNAPMSQPLDVQTALAQILATIEAVDRSQYPELRSGIGELLDANDMDASGLSGDQPPHQHPVVPMLPATGQPRVPPSTAIDRRRLPAPAQDAAFHARFPQARRIDTVPSGPRRAPYDPRKAALYERDRAIAADKHESFLSRFPEAR